MECGSLSYVDANVWYVIVLLRNSSIIARVANVIPANLCYRNNRTYASNTNHIIAIYALEGVY